MDRYLWGRLRHQAGRTAALMVGILIATASFVVLTGAATGRPVPPEAGAATPEVSPR